MRQCAEMFPEVAIALCLQRTAFSGRVERMAPRPAFGDRVRIAASRESDLSGFAGRTGHVYGDSVPSESGVGPVTGDRGEDVAYSVFFGETEQQEWFAPHLVEFVDRGGTPMAGRGVGHVLSRAVDRIGRWIRRQGT
jgi:hypothetical protein